MNNYSRIERHIREAQLQRSVEIADAIGDALVWITRGIQALAGRPGRTIKPEATAQH
ncbi:hypothetical protein DSM104440_00789 [Usitatibacter palustris]|uniref:Uncharacterized protein n=1 Tax=Usitatibacter palustris TaxID=2732487 RepID=A0A6M4H7N0_9PROT|nr:hypothetical protein DSM104440_00789 [Usitatibacter palustris]